MNWRIELSQIYAVEWEAAGVAFIAASSAEDAETAVLENKEFYINSTEEEFDVTAEPVDEV
jgi:hypothetical protein